MMFNEALKQNIAYVIGSAFHIGDEGKNTMRLNFSFSTDEQIEEGIKRLSNVIRKEIDFHIEQEKWAREGITEGGIGV